MIRTFCLALLIAAPVWANDAVGRLNTAGFKSRAMCSGTLVRPTLVLTAAHCVARAEDGYAHSIKDMVFVAGWDGGTHAGASRVASVTVHPDAFTTGRLDIAHDMALIELSEPIDLPSLPVGRAMVSEPMTVMGYKRARPHKLSVEQDCDASMLGSLLRLGCSVQSGQSGGPVLAGEGEALRIVGVLVARRDEEALAVPVDTWLRAMLALDR